MAGVNGEAQKRANALLDAPEFVVRDLGTLSTGDSIIAHRYRLPGHHVSCIGIGRVEYTFRGDETGQVRIDPRDYAIAALQATPCGGRYARSSSRSSAATRFLH
jgi:hypothetical protein